MKIESTEKTNIVKIETGEKTNIPDSTDSEKADLTDTVTTGSEKADLTDTVTTGSEKADLTDTEANSTEIKVDQAAVRGWKKRAAYFLSGQAASMFGSMLVQHAMVFYLTLKYESGTIMMISMLCGFLPQIIISLFSGVFADRINRKTLIIFSDGIIAASTLVLALIFIGGYKELWLLFTVMAVRSLGSGIQSPAVSAFIPQITPMDKLMKINGINSAVQSIVMLVSPVVAAAVLAGLSLEAIFFIDVGTAAIAILIMIIIHAPKKERQEGKTSYFSDLAKGIKFIIKERPLWTFLVYWTLFMFLLTPVILLPAIHIARAFGGGEWRLALSEMLFALGALISGIAISAGAGFKSRLKNVIIGCLIFSVFTLIMGLGENTFLFVFGRPVFGNVFFFAIFVGCMFVSGLGMSFVNIPSMTLIQEYVEPSMHGRVFGILQIVSSAAIPVGTIFVGPLADVINIEIMFAVSGMLMLITCILMIFNKSVKKMEKKRSGGKES